MTVYKALHPWDDIEKIYVSRTEGGREHALIQDRVDASIQWFEDYINKIQRKFDYSNQKQYWQHKH